MADKDDYLTYYREFFENFAQTVNPNDQLPVKLASYKLINVEVVGGVIDWTTQYLTQKKCPEHLIAPLIKIVIEETRKTCKKHPLSCGFNPADNAYEPLKLMQTVMAKLNEVCLRYLDNSMLCSLPSPGTPYFITSVSAARNTRRKMEDRHVVIQDLNTMFNIQEASPSSYYAIFDGHAGHDAAAYSSAHLHQFLAESKHFVTNPEQALLDAFCKTDSLFIDKCKVENLSSGTTALVALLRPKEKTLYVAWAGDSLALLVNQGRVMQIVNPHKPNRPDEKRRIEEQGGCVLLWGIWRVNGQLAVSRAIGDAEYKPYVIAVPEIREISLDGGEDFLILACDGLWDFVSEDHAARMVYHLITENPDDTDRISHHLVQLAKTLGSTDNISVIVVFLREPSKIAAEAHWANRNCSTANMETGLDNANNPFAISNNSAAASDIISQKTEELLLNLDNFKQNGTDLSEETDFFHKEKSNGKRSASDFEDDDFGPETNVDTVDDVLHFCAENKTKNFEMAQFKDDDAGHFNPFMEHQEKAALEMERKKKEESSAFDELKFCEETKQFDDNLKREEDLNLDEVQEQKIDELSDIQKLAREETPTPPADAVHDVSGLEENAVDTESEDEWNYIKGDVANKENLPPSQPDREVADITAEDSNMSQLNPNAAEFVPVSPTRGVASPVCKTLIDDEVITQSPRRANQEIDINLPNPKDFEKEVKSRPSEIEDPLNQIESNGDNKPADLIENILNGKNIDDIPEFHPGSTPKKTSGEEFHFGPNAAPYTPVKLLDQSEATLSTKAVYGDESIATLGTTLESAADISNVNKESDPMSMSFYADKEDKNPFDLNEIHVLPDNVDEFIEKGDASEFNETISDLPEHQIFSNEPQVTVNNDDAIQITDLDKHSYDDEKELASPMEPEKELVEEDFEMINKTPEPTHENLLGQQFCSDAEKQTSFDCIPRDVELISPEPLIETKEVTSEENKETSYEENKEITSEENKETNFEENKEITSEENKEISSEENKEISSEENKEISFEENKEKSSELDKEKPFEESTEITSEENKEATEVADLLQANIENISMDIELIPTPANATQEEILSEPHNLRRTPEVEDLIQYQEQECVIEHNQEIHKSPEPVEESIISESPICEIAKSPVLEQEIVETTPDFIPEKVIEKAQEHFEELCQPLETITENEMTCSTIPEESSQINIADSEPNFNVVSDLVINEDKLTSDEVVSPLSPNEPEVPTEEASYELEQTQIKVEEPLPIQTRGEEIDVKTESIGPEFAEKAVVTPSEESRNDDVPVPETQQLLNFGTDVLVNESFKNEKPEIKDDHPIETVYVAPTTAAAATAAIVNDLGVAAKVLPNKKPTPTKKPATKTFAPTKPPVPATRTVASPKVPPKTSTTTANKPAPSKPTTNSPKTTSRPPSAPSNKPRTTAPSAKPLERKPNGDVISATRTITAKKDVAPKVASRSVASKVTASIGAKSPSKVSTAAKPARPATTAITKTTTSVTRTTTNTTAAKRPNTLGTAKSVGAANLTSTTTKTTVTRTSPKAAPPKPKVLPSTLTARPKVLSAKAAPDAEKQIKESANKITASRNVSARAPASASARNVTTRKVENKVSSHTTISKTTTTTMKSTTAKKPTEIVKNVASKTKTTKIEKPKENGVSAVVTEEIHVVNSVIEGEPQLLKDNSPLDNKLVVESLIQNNTVAD